MFLIASAMIPARSALRNPIVAIGRPQGNILGRKYTGCCK